MAIIAAANDGLMTKQVMGAAVSGDCGRTVSLESSTRRTGWKVEEFYLDQNRNGHDRNCYTKLFDELIRLLSSDGVIKVHQSTLSATDAVGS